MYNRILHFISRIVIVVATVTILHSCHKGIWEELNNINEKITALEVALNALENKLSIISVENNGDGYTIVFSDGSTAIIKDGKDGADGKDGVDGKDGADGKDGKDGDTYIREIIIEDTYVKFCLTDGTDFIIPIYGSISLVIDKSNDIIAVPNSTISIPISWESSISPVIIECISSADIKSRIIFSETQTNSATVEILFAEEFDEYSKVVVFASNGERIAMKTLTFERAELTVKNGNILEFTSEGGIVDLSVFSNIGFKIIVPEEYNSWIHAEITKSLSEYHATLTIDENTSHNERNGIIRLLGESHSHNVDITIMQKAAIDAYLEKDSLVVGKNGGTYEIPILTNANLELTIPSDIEWVKKIETKKLDETTHTISVEKNSSGKFRECTLVFSYEDLNVPYVVCQLSDNYILRISHECTQLYYPQIIGDNVLSIIEWGDGASDTYPLSTPHDYSASTNTSAYLYFNDLPESIVIQNVRDITHLDLSKL